MALNKNPQKPAFEQEQGEGGAAVAETQTQQSAAPAVDAAAASVTATTAIAAASSTSVAVADAARKAKEFQKEVDAMKGAADFSFGNYDVYKGNNGEIVKSGGDEASLGRWAKVRMLSWDEHFEVSPGEDGASSKEFVAYSKDGKTIDSVIGEGDQRNYVGKSVDEYVQYLRTTEEFDKAGVRRFVDIGAALLGCENADDAPVGSVIQITLSQSSIPAFSKYQEDLKNKARCVAMGLPGFILPDDPFTFFFVREPASKGEKKWTKLKIVTALPAKI